jgi:hypothetical protein
LLYNKTKEGYSMLEFSPIFGKTDEVELTDAELAAISGGCCSGGCSGGMGFSPNAGYGYPYMVEPVADPIAIVAANPAPAIVAASPAQTVVAAASSAQPVVAAASSAQPVVATELVLVSEPVGLSYYGFGGGSCGGGCGGHCH